MRVDLCADATAWLAASPATATARMEHLGAPSLGDDLTTYHFESGIAALHAMSPSVEATPWHDEFAPTASHVRCETWELARELLR